MAVVKLRNDTYNVNGGKLVDVLNKLGLNIDEYVATRNDEILFDNDIIYDDDEVELIPVISGG